MPITRRWSIAFQIFGIVTMSSWFSSAFLDASDADNGLEWSNSRNFKSFTYFAFSFLLFQFPAGIVAYSFKPKRVLAIALAASFLLTLFTPIMSSLPDLLFLNRVLLGMALSLVLPACFCLFECWATSGERNRFVIFCYSGIYAGSFLSSFSAFCIPSNSYLDLSWTWCMYVPAILGAVMLVVWHFHGLNSPILSDEFTNQSNSSIDSTDQLLAVTDSPLLSRKLLDDEVQQQDVVFSPAPSSLLKSSISSEDSTSSYAGSFASRRFNMPGDGELDNVNLDVIYDLNPSPYSLPKMTATTTTSQTSALQQEVPLIEPQEDVKPAENYVVYLLLLIKPSVVSLYLIHFTFNFMTYSFQIPPAQSASSSSTATLEVNAALALLLLLLVNSAAYLTDAVIAKRWAPVHVIRKLIPAIGLSVSSTLLVIIAAIIVANVDTVDDDELHFDAYISRILDILTVFAIIFYSIVVVGFLPNLIELCRFSTSSLAFSISNTFALIPSILAPFLLHQTVTSGSIQREASGFLYYSLAIFVLCVSASLVWLACQSSYALFSSDIAPTTRNRTRTSTSCS